MHKRSKTYFLSDLHLGARYLPDKLAQEKKVCAFLDSIKHEAKTIYLLGDILDYWYEYRYVVPKGHIRFFGKLAELADSGIRIVWLIGNHDIWIFDYLPSELGIEVIDGSITEEIDGHTFYLAHGDAIGKLKPSFKFIRSLFRNRIAQKLFSGIHPRWTVPFAYSWSRQSRCSDGGSAASTEIDNYRKFSLSVLNKRHIDHFIFGHLHLLHNESIASQTDMTILGEWIDTCSYAVFHDGRLDIHVFKQYTY